MTMKEFIFNDCGVCTNPNVIEKSTGVCDYEITTAFLDDGWGYGYAFHVSANGMCGGISKERSKRYATEREAIVACAERALQFMQEPHYTGLARNEYVKVPQDIIQSLQDIIKPQPRQLSLFD